MKWEIIYYCLMGILMGWNLKKLFPQKTLYIPKTHDGSYSIGAYTSQSAALTAIMKFCDGSKTFEVKDFYIASVELNRKQ